MEGFVKVSNGSVMKSRTLLPRNPKKQSLASLWKLTSYAVDARHVELIDKINPAARTGRAVPPFALSATSIARLLLLLGQRRLLDVDEQRGVRVAARAPFRALMRGVGSAAGRSSGFPTLRLPCPQRILLGLRRSVARGRRCISSARNRRRWLFHSAVLVRVGPPRLLVFQGYRVLQSI